jgi:hypothetical protein
MNSLPSRLPILLSGTHVLLFLTTVVSNNKSASYGNPLFCVDLPISLPLVARNDVRTTVLVGIVATAWWYVVGQIGAVGERGTTGRRMAAVGGAIVLPIVCAIDAYALFTRFREIFRDPVFGGVDVVIYVLAVGLLSGGFLSATHAWLATLGRSS